MAQYSFIKVSKYLDTKNGICCNPNIYINAVYVTGLMCYSASYPFNSWCIDRL